MKTIHLRHKGSYSSLLESFPGNIPLHCFGNYKKQTLIAIKGDEMIDELKPGNKIKIITVKISVRNQAEKQPS